MKKSLSETNWNASSPTETCDVNNTNNHMQEQVMIF